jgi:hypothetical protein
MNTSTGIMTERQALAFSEPCARANGTVRAFWMAVDYKGLRLSTILTVNK